MKPSPAPESAAAPPKHDIFISYSRRDEPFAAKLEQALERYTPPRGIGVQKHGMRVFRDRDDFTGVDYAEAIDQHLADSAKLVVICSPAARQSKFVGDEIRKFGQRMKGEGLVPVLLAGLPNNEVVDEREAEKAYPEALYGFFKMPLGADYRSFDPKRHKVDRGAFTAAWYTLLANIYGVSREVIEAREERRRRR